LLAKQQQLLAAISAKQEHEQARLLSRQQRFAID
jgi:hypothetical protein